MFGFAVAAITPCMVLGVLSSHYVGIVATNIMLCGCYSYYYHAIWLL